MDPLWATIAGGLATALATVGGLYLKEKREVRRLNEEIKRILREENAMLLEWLEALEDDK